MSGRKNTPRGQMTRGGNSGPAVMLMPPDIRSTFMPNPPLQSIPPLTYRRKNKWTGVAGYLVHFEKKPPPERVILPTPKSMKEKRKQLQQITYKKELEPKVEAYRKQQRECGGEYEGMNCYNTLFVGRLVYEVKERKLLREMEVYGPVKDIKIIHDKEGKSRGYAFVEYEHEEDMKRAYRGTDGMRIDGREIVADVERGHTVPTWLPRRLGGGLGGTRLGGKDVNVTRPGRFDPSRPEPSRPMPMDDGPMGRGGPPPPPQHYGYGGPPPPPRDWDRGVGPPMPRGGPPPPYGGPPPRDWDRGGSGHRGRDSSRDRDRDRKRQRSRSPPRDWDRGARDYRRR